MIFALILAAYTNHAGFAVSGVPVKIESKFVTLSNDIETLKLPFSAFPECERRRLAADGGSTQFVPKDVVRAVEGLAKSVRRADGRLSKDLVSKKDHDDFVNRADAAKKAYLDKAVSEGVISVRERKLLECE